MEETKNTYLSDEDSFVFNRDVVLSDPIDIAGLTKGVELKSNEEVRENRINRSCHTASDPTETHSDSCLESSTTEKETRNLLGTSQESTNSSFKQLSCKQKQSTLHLAESKGELIADSSRILVTDSFINNLIEKDRAETEDAEQIQTCDLKDRRESPNKTSKTKDTRNTEDLGSDEENLENFTKLALNETDTNEFMIDYTNEFCDSHNRIMEQQLLLKTVKNLKDEVDEVIFTDLASLTKANLVDVEQEICTSSEVLDKHSSNESDSKEGTDRKEETSISTNVLEEKPFPFMENPVQFEKKYNEMMTIFLSLVVNRKNKTWS